jgi:hypothetical protein
MTTQLQYKIKENVAIVSKLTKEVIRGNIINEKDIDGKSFWVMVTYNRPGTQLIFSKDAWFLQFKGK